LIAGDNIHARQKPTRYVAEEKATSRKNYILDVERRPDLGSELGQVLEIIRCTAVSVGANVPHSIDCDDVNILALMPLVITTPQNSDKGLATLESRHHLASRPLLGPSNGISIVFVDFNLHDVGSLLVVPYLRNAIVRPFLHLIPPGPPSSDDPTILKNLPTVSRDGSNLSLHPLVIAFSSALPMFPSGFPPKGYSCYAYARYRGLIQHNPHIWGIWIIP